LTTKGVGRKTCRTLNCGVNGKCIEKNNTSLCQCSDGTIKRKKCPQSVSKQQSEPKEQSQNRSSKNKPVDDLKKNKNKKMEGKKKSNKAGDLKKNKSEFKNKKIKGQNKKNIQVVVQKP
jgi:hypothetical protein